MPASHDHRRHLNLGALTLRAPAAAGPTTPGPRTITVIATGVGRSGTSMVAQVLDAIGIPMGNTENLPVHEDKDFLHALLYFDFHRLTTLIDARNEASPRWGFKFPSLQNHLLAPQLAKFRNPYLIVVMRDPVAIATRALVSDPESASPVATLTNVTRQVSDLIALVERADCPALLLSYEKFLAFPEQTIKAIASFCRITPLPAQLAAARQAVVPNNPEYIELFHNPYRGHFDGVADGHAVGWCAGPNANAPVTVELLAGETIIATTQAALFRPDLLQAGIGLGAHAFRFNLSGLSLPPHTELSVRAQGERTPLEGSPKKLPF
jgi:hypothetical protein